MVVCFCLFCFFYLKPSWIFLHMIHSMKPYNRLHFTQRTCDSISFIDSGLRLSSTGSLSDSLCEARRRAASSPAYMKPLEVNFLIKAPLSPSPPASPCSCVSGAFCVHAQVCVCVAPLLHIVCICEWTCMFVCAKCANVNCVCAVGAYCLCAMCMYTFMFLCV